MDPDLSTLSVEELLSLKGAQARTVATQPTTSSLESLSTEELLALKDSSINRDWNVTDSVKNLASGLVEGVTGAIGLAADLNPLQFGGPKLNFPATKTMGSLVEPILAEKDPQYRYARTIGNFAAPVPIKGANTLRNLLTSVVAGFGAQGAEDATGDTKIAPLVGAVTTSGAASAISDLGSLLKRILVGASKDEITGSAAKAFADQTGLTTNELAAANMGPRNLLEDAQTTAERTGNAGVAQLEKTLAATGDNANAYADLEKTRTAAREGVIEKLSEVDSVNKEGLGASLINTAEDIQGRMQQNSAAFWEGVPRDTPIDIGPEQASIAGILDQRQGGLNMGSKTRTLVEQFLETPVQNSGRLQDIRADALSLSRADNLAPIEQRVLVVMQGGIDDAMARGLEGPEFDIWRAARQSTAAEKQTFGRGTAGGYLVGDAARTSTVLDKVFKGDRQAVTELRAAIGENPELMEQVKRGVLEMIPRDAQGQLTAAKMKGFLSSNETGLKELFGQSHYANLSRVYEDLKSQAGVKDLAYAASKGNSVTSQKETVAGALRDAITESLLPGTGGPFSRVIEAVKQGAGIKDTKAVEDLLFKAALDPKFAEQLSKAPSNRRILSALESLAQARNNAVSSGGLVAAKELSREQDNRTPLARLIDDVIASGRSQASSQPHLEAELSPKEEYLSQKASPSLQPTDTPIATQDYSFLKTMFKGGDMELSEKEIPVFEAKVDKIAKDLGADPEHLLAVMNFETGGTFSSSVKNRAGSGATGLIQFMPDTAKELTGAETKDAAIKLMESMTPTEQLDYVKKHLGRFKGKLNSLEDVYMAVLYPKAVGMDNEYALFKKGTTAYWQNRGLDLDKDGVITKAEATSKVRQVTA